MGQPLGGSLHESALSVRHLKTLANSGRQQRLPLPQRSERTGGQLISSAPNVVSGEPDVFPAERRYMPQQVLVDRHALAPQLRVGHLVFQWMSAARGARDPHSTLARHGLLVSK